MKSAVKPELACVFFKARVTSIPISSSESQRSGASPHSFYKTSVIAFFMTRGVFVKIKIHRSENCGLLNE